jgi:DNA-binding phage protein
VTEDNPIARHYHGVATLDQVMKLLRENVGCRRPTITARRGYISKSSIYDVLNNYENVTVRTLLNFCKSYDLDLVVAVRKKS